jgi:hypothetical protein
MSLAYETRPYCVPRYLTRFRVNIYFGDSTGDGVHVLIIV